MRVLGVVLCVCGAAALRRSVQPSFVDRPHAHLPASAAAARAPAKTSPLRAVHDPHDGIADDYLGEWTVDGGEYATTSGVAATRARAVALGAARTEAATATRALTAKNARHFVEHTEENSGSIVDYPDMGLCEFTEQRHRIFLLHYYMEVRVNLTETLGRQPTVDEWACCLNMASRDLKADLLRSEKVRTQLVQKHMVQVRAIAKKYTGLGVPLTDLLQEGSCGLLRAAEKYDPALGHKFSTYAAHWIRQSISNSLNKDSRMIYLPRKVHDQVTSLSRTVTDMSTSLGREPTEEELARAVELHPKKLRRYRMVSQKMTSLSTSIGPSSLGAEYRPNALEDQMMDHDLPLPEEIASNRLLRAHVLKVLDNLPELERDVISLRYGLRDGTPRTYEEVASSLSHDSARCPRTVRNAASRGLNKLRGPNYTYMLESFLQSGARGPKDGEEEDAAFEFNLARAGIAAAALGRR